MPRLQAEEALRERGKEMSPEELYNAVLEVTGDEDQASKARATKRLREQMARLGVG